MARARDIVRVQPQEYGREIRYDDMFDAFAENSESEIEQTRQSKELVEIIASTFAIRNKTRKREIREWEREKDRGNSQSHLTCFEIKKTWLKSADEKGIGS